MFRNLEIKIKSINGSFITWKYMTSNAKTRMKTTQFIENYKQGMYNVVNPEALPEELKESENA